MKIRSLLDSPVAYHAWTRLLGMRGYYQVLVREHIRPQPSDRILEIVCGPGTMVPHLAVAEYVGFDLNPQYIQRAQARFPERRFVCERVSGYSLETMGHFDIVLALGVVHHLDDGEAKQLFELAGAALKPSGRLVTLDGVYANNQSRAAKYLLDHDRGQYVRSESAYQALAANSFREVHSTVRHDLLWIPYTHVILECRSQFRERTGADV